MEGIIQLLQIVFASTPLATAFIIGAIFVAIAIIRKISNLVDLSLGTAVVLACFGLGLIAVSMLVAAGSLPKAGNTPGLQPSPIAQQLTVLAVPTSTNPPPAPPTDTQSAPPANTQPPAPPTDTMSPPTQEPPTSELPTSVPPTPLPTSLVLLTAQQVLNLLIPDSAERALATAHPNGIVSWTVDTKNGGPHGQEITFRHPGYGRFDYWGGYKPTDDASCRPTAGIDPTSNQPEWLVVCTKPANMPSKMDGVTWWPYEK